MVAPERKTTPRQQSGRLCRSAAFTVALCVAPYPAAIAKEAGSAQDVAQYLKDRDPKTALITLKNAIRKSPQDPTIRVEIAQLYFQLGDVASAEREARAARDLKGGEADYLPVLLDAMLARKEFKEIYDEIEPGDRNPVLESKTRTALGTAAVRLGYDTRAEALLRDAIQLDPTVVEPRIQLARFLSATRPEEAVGVVDEAIAANPKSAELLQVKGDMLWSLGDANWAVRLFGEALEIDPDYPLARLSRANVNVARDEFAAADADLDPVLQASPKNFMAKYLRGLEYVRQQNYVAADQTFSAIAGAFTAFPYGYYVQGATKFALGQAEAAEGMLGEYLGRVPGDPEATRLIASAALQQHGAARAIDYLKPLADKSRPDAKTLALLGNAYMVDGKPELALQQFEKAASIDPENKAIKTRVAVAELGAGRGKQGLENLEDIFAGGAGEIIAGPMLVIAEWRAGHLEKASAVALSLVEREPKNAIYQTLLGEVRVAQRDDVSAEIAFRAALSQNPEFPAATRDLAMLFLKAQRMRSGSSAISFRRRQRIRRPSSVWQTSRSRRRNGRKRPTCSTVLARPPCTIRSPGSNWSASTSCGVIGRAPKPLRPSSMPNSREMWMWSLRRAGRGSNRATRTGPYQPTSLLTSSSRIRPQSAPPMWPC